MSLWISCRTFRIIAGHVGWYVRDQANFISSLPCSPSTRYHLLFKSQLSWAAYTLMSFDLMRLSSGGDYRIMTPDHRWPPMPPIFTGIVLIDKWRFYRILHCFWGKLGEILIVVLQNWPKSIYPKLIKMQIYLYDLRDIYRCLWECFIHHVGPFKIAFLPIWYIKTNTKYRKGGFLPRLALFGSSDPPQRMLTTLKLFLMCIRMFNSSRRTI